MKKVLLWIGIVIVAALGALWVVGGRTYQYSTSAMIAAPPERV